MLRRNLLRYPLLLVSYLVCASAFTATRTQTLPSSSSQQRQRGVNGDEIQRRGRPLRVANDDDDGVSQADRRLLGRDSFLRRALSSSYAGVVACAAFAPSSPAFAKTVDPKLVGTKADPKYEACVSQCVYECTKPKGDEQKSRAECIPLCKKQCATNKEQLMIGTPVKKE